MNELHLFAACGGGTFAGRLLGHRQIGYVEREPYRCRVLAQRIADGILSDAPVYCGSVREFIDNGYAVLYRQVAQVVCAGFPCPPFSLAGKRLGERDPRNGWPETRDCLGIVQPDFAFLENVPGLISHPYFQKIVQDIHQLGYRLRGTVLGGIDVGAPHIRKRLWLLAYANKEGCAVGSEMRERSELSRGNISCGRCERDLPDAPENRGAAGVTNPASGHQGSAAELDDARPALPESNAQRCSGRQNYQREQTTQRGRTAQSTVPDANDSGREKQWRAGAAREEDAAAQRSGSTVSHPEQVSGDPGEESAGRQTGTDVARSGHRAAMVFEFEPGCDYSRLPDRIRWWDAEPRLGRMAHGVANRVERLEAIGDGQIPAVAALAWRVLTRGLL